MSVSVEGKLICALIFFIFVSSALNSLFNCSVVLLRIIERRHESVRQKDKREDVVLDITFSKSSELFIYFLETKTTTTTYFVAASNVVMFFAKSNKSFLFLSACYNVQQRDNNIRRNNVRDTNEEEIL